MMLHLYYEELSKVKSFVFICVKTKSIEIYGNKSNGWDND